MQRAGRWLTSVLFWGGVGTLAASVVWLRGGATLSWFRLAALHVPHWLVWAPATLGIRAIHRQLAPRGLGRVFALHLPLCLAAVLLHSVWVSTWDLVSVSDLVQVSWSQVFRNHLARNTTFEVVTYFAVLGVALLLGTAPRPSPSATTSGGRRASAADPFAVRVGRSLLRLEQDDIGWLEAAGNYVRIRSRHGRHVVRASLSHLTTLLDDRFIRIHRSHVVNIDRVQRIESSGRWHKRVILDDGHTFRASQDGWRDLSARLGTRVEQGP